MNLSEKVITEIDKWLVKYPQDQRRSALLPALTAAQKDNGGHLTNDHIEAVAAYLKIPTIAAYEAATFYSMYQLAPVGQFLIEVCTNISCDLCGCDRIVNHLEKRLGIRLGETTRDGKYTLKSVECLAACASAPAMQINHRYYEHLTPERIDSILDELEGQPHSHA